MIQIPLTDADISFLKTRLIVEDYAGGYYYLNQVIQKAIPNQTDENARDQLLMTANWLVSAQSINNVDGSWVSEMVLNSMQYAVEQSGRNFTGAMYKNASNELARSVIKDFIAAKGVLPIQEVIDRDVQSAVKGLGLEAWQWGGTLGDVFPMWMGGLGHDFVEVPGDTFLEGMNNWTTVIVQNIVAIGMTFEKHLGNASMITPIAAKYLLEDLLIGDEKINISFPIVPGDGVGGGGAGGAGSGGNGGSGGVTSGSGYYGTGGGVPVTGSEESVGTIDISLESVGGLNYISPAQSAKMKCALESKSDPIILDLDGSGVSLSNPYLSSVHFDMNNDGSKIQTGWSGASEGIVVLDLNKNGEIDNISELISEFFGAPQGNNDTPSIKTFENSVSALRSLDSNNDMLFDIRDNSWEDIKVWIDSNQDGQSWTANSESIRKTSELYSLTDLGISQIDLSFKEQSSEKRNENDIIAFSSFTQNGTTKEAAAVNFTTLTYTEPETITTLGTAHPNSELGIA